MSCNTASRLAQACFGREELPDQPAKRPLQDSTDDEEEQCRQEKRPRPAHPAEAEYSTSGQGHQYSNIYIYEPGSVQLGDCIGIRPQHSSTNASADDLNRHDLLLKSLLFDRIDFRVNNVKQALWSTCRWLLEHATFRAWCDHSLAYKHNGFIWIKGKPGCGKSTLMKTALEWMRHQQSKSGFHKTVVSYFFNARAFTSLEKSSLGLYRTVVHHLVSVHAPLRRLFFDTFAFKAPEQAGDDWTKAELQNFLLRAVDCQYSFELSLFIDALDEAEHEQDVRDMIQFLMDLSDRATGGTASCRLQICLSSRHYPHITIGRGLSLVVEEQVAHGRDIDLYITQRLICSEGPDKDDLRDQISAKSNRIFLWVVLVVEILNRLDDHGAPLSEMKAHLQAIPAGLHELFHEILTRGDHGIETSILFFQWTMFAQRPLEPAELYMAMEYSRSPADTAWTLPAQMSVPSRDRLGKYILNCSRGLVEVVSTVPSQPPIVQFIHETVREFLLKENGLASICPALASNLVGISHGVLRVACSRATSTTPILPEYQQYIEANHQSNSSLETFRRNMRLELPFLDYAISSLFHHVGQAHTHGISQAASFQAQTDERGCWRDPFRQWWNVLERYKSRKVEKSTLLLSWLIDKEFLHLVPLLADKPAGSSDLRDAYDCALCRATERGFPEVVRMLLNSGANADAQGKYRSHKRVNALYVAADLGHQEIVEILLSNNADANAQGGRYGNALQAASARGHEAIVQMMLDRGADVNTKGGLHGNALYAASEGGHEKIVQILLDRDADVNAQGGLYGNALQAASARGYEAVVQMLRNRGADVKAYACR